MESTTDGEDNARFASTYISTPDYADHLTRATFRYVVVRPGSLFLLILAAIVVPTIVFAATFGPAYPPHPLLGLLVALVLIVVIGLSVAILYRSVRRIDRRQFPTGSQFSLEFRDSSLRIVSPFFAGDVAYAVYRSAALRGEVVVLKPVYGRGATLLPRQLFLPGSLEWLGTRLRENPPAVRIKPTLRSPR
jgi:hypothetical protein